MRTDALHYELPPELIASVPLAARDASRMLVVNRARDGFVHASVRDLAAHVPAGALLVVNDTKVIPARLRGHKASGGKAELLLLRQLDETATRWEALGKASKGLRPGMVIDVAPGLTVTVSDRDDEGVLTVVLNTNDPWASLDAHGEVPLPPYMHRAPDASDRARYQTLYARAPGAVAAPTAGLHLTDAVFAALAEKGVTRASVTLHVGMGTFAPVSVDDLDRHPMHAEWYEVPDATADAVLRAKREGRPVVAVGTTVVRTLESWRGDGARQGFTRMLIQPGYAFAMVDALLTNFHLPKSTLLALVMALAGEDRIRAAYAEAIAERYRFFSYGDAMLIV